MCMLLLEWEFLYAFTWLVNEYVCVPVPTVPHVAFVSALAICWFLFPTQVCLYMRVLDVQVIFFALF